MLNRALLADMIGDAYRIIEAEDGKQAVAALQKEGAGISLVLLDYVMPQMNGFDVLEVMNKKRLDQGHPGHHGVRRVRRRLYRTRLRAGRDRLHQPPLRREHRPPPRHEHAHAVPEAAHAHGHGGRPGVRAREVQQPHGVHLVAHRGVPQRRKRHARAECAGHDRDDLDAAHAPDRSVSADHRGHLAYHDGLQLARHRQDRHPRGDPEQAGPFHRRRVRHHEDPLRRGLRYAGRSGAVQGREASEGRAGHLPLAP